MRGCEREGLKKRNEKNSIHIERKMEDEAKDEAEMCSYRSMQTVGAEVAIVPSCIHVCFVLLEIVMYIKR